jgi:hypothetical protein
MFLHQAIVQGMIYTNPFNFNLTIHCLWFLQTKHHMYHYSCLKLHEAPMLVVQCIHEVAKKEQLNSYQPFQKDPDHDTKKLQP